MKQYKVVKVYSFPLIDHIAETLQIALDKLTYEGYHLFDIKIMDRTILIIGEREVPCQKVETHTPA